SAGYARRQERHIVYLKKSENISDFLILTGAHAAMMELENIRVFKDVKNNLNRADNCLFGNMGKTVTAAQKQLDDIRALRSAGVHLSEPLEEACLLRMANPEASLEELARISGNTTKSALNKRFSKIRAMREGIR
ncbi:MAG: DNA-binding protein WhiA, partial [Clostridia bacterium]|nr:DNA-binding protein WhiA [Clostridia bacterium]